jgi:hypothetical protein
MAGVEKVYGESNFEIRLEGMGKTDVSGGGQPQDCQYSSEYFRRSCSEY